ncbi:hypothetical protein MTR67_006758 [Solanum verrucosum]|uniref:Uncharacterized protein n=1 Tax=Solanum verrucosum TaxID=315347 RepID=A0AAF0TEC1_SOLVR|nr:hypothetical protein MTR67_006758 [Solanum verrucosum]
MDPCMDTGAGIHLKIIKREESLWRQKSRALWRKEGDKNTKFFHRIANAYRRYNNIDQLMVQREITQEPHKIEGEIIDFYKKLYTETAQWRPTLQDAQCPVITEEEKEALQANFEESEVLRCLKMCAVDNLVLMDSLWDSSSSVMKLLKKT